MEYKKEPGRQLPFKKVLNLRDLGGYTTVTGRTVNYGCFFRGPQLKAISDPEDVELFKSLGIRLNFDFRSSMERENHPDPDYPGMERIEMSAILDAAGKEINFDPNQSLLALGAQKVEDILAEMDLFYCRMPFNNDAYKRFFKEIRMENVPLYFHCTAGKDRTGIAAALLLLTLGVSREDVTRDYCLTNEYRAPVMAKVREGLSEEFLAHPRIEEFLQTSIGVRKELLDRALNAIDRVYGDFSTYIKAEYGIDEIERFRLQKLYTTRE